MEKYSELELQNSDEVIEIDISLIGEEEKTSDEVIELDVSLMQVQRKTLDEIGHELAKQYIYPAVFGPKIMKIDNVGHKDYAGTGENKDFEKEIKKRELDYYLGIDTKVTAKVTFAGYTKSADFTVQERAVRHDHGNICIRLLNDYGNPSEFFNFGAANFLLMVVENEELKKWIWIPHATRIISMLLDGTLDYRVIPSKNSLSEFIIIDVSDLEAAFPGEIIQWPPQKPLS